MTAEVIHCRRPSTAKAQYLDAISSLPRENRLATWISDEDAPFGEQPPAKRVQLVLYTVYMADIHIINRTTPVSDILSRLARLTLYSGYAAISQITNAAYPESQGTRGSGSCRRIGTGSGQNAPGSTVPTGPGGSGGGGGPSKRPGKRGGSGDRGASKKLKHSSEPQDTPENLCIVFELTPGEERGTHPCRGLRFSTLQSAIEHHLRIHVRHIQCDTCLIRKGTKTDMGKHEKRPCALGEKIRGEVKTHGESVRTAKSWGDFRERVAPGGQIQYDMARNIDRLVPPPDTNQGDAQQQVPGDDFDQSRIVGIVQNMLNDFEPLPYSDYPHYPKQDTNITFNPAWCGTVNPQDLVRSDQTDSGCRVEGSSYQRSLAPAEVEQSQVTSGGNEATGVGGDFNRDEVVERSAGDRLLERVNLINEAFLACDKNESDRHMAKLCAKNIALILPVEILQVFAEMYGSKMEEAQSSQSSGYRY